ncbi:MAG: MopE-related protein [Myxococcota bacterium]
MHSPARPLLLACTLAAASLAAGCKGGCDKADEIAAFADDDGDGYAAPPSRAPASSRRARSPWAATATTTTPASTPARPSPSATASTRICDGLDNGADALLFFEDLDGDGYGNDDVPLLACDAPEGWARFGEDCDDTDAARNPGAIEVCNSGVDDDCDDLIDDEDDSLDETSL